MKTAALAVFLNLFAPSAGAQEAVLPPIVVTAARDRGYAPGDVSVGGLGGESAPILLTPASVTVFTRAELTDEGQGTLSDAVRRDAFVGDSYAPVGYYQNIQIRGFPLDLGTGYRINGLTVVGEQNVALENKERLEIWNGAAGLEAGDASPGGVVNYVTKRPADVLELTSSVNSSGGRAVAADFGRVLDDDHRTGWRVNAASEELSPPVSHALGHRNFASLAADWGFSDDGIVKFDADYQRRVQNSVPGYQLLGGTAAPPLPDPTRLLGWQPWTKPVAVDSYNMSLSLDDELAPGLRLHAAAGRSAAHIDDNIAFPYGCGSLPYFCANGDYTIWDFRSSGERRRADDAVVSLSGDAAPFRLAQTWTAGAEYFERAVDMSSWIYVPVGTDNIFNPNPVVVPPSGAAAPVAYRILNHVQDSLFARDVAELGAWRLNA
ncbi:MAG: TonB-dependent receptor plug domain-containing protein, partial [Elusimicrobia bacterium]|nr:TonB-dependent receptor plug domain-containing protein [Elusimicrobiota bacterium]